MYGLKSSYQSILFPFAWMLIICIGIIACEKDDNISAALKVDMMMIPATDTLPPVIAENTLLTNTHTWYIHDWSYITNEAVLSIEPGAIIKIIRKKDTNGGLVITRGSKIIARGLRNWPVLFQLDDTACAANAGWSGIVVLGKAPQKQPFTVKDNMAAIHNSSGWAYGGEQADDSSGVLQHIRIVTAPCNHTAANNKFQKGLLLLGVGHKTVVEDVVTDTARNSPYRMANAPLK